MNTFSLAKCLFTWILLASVTSPAGDLTLTEAEARLRVARQIAREHNDGNLVSRLESLARELREGLPGDAEARLRQAETAVGIDPGGWSMAGQPLYHPTLEMQAKLKALGPRLTVAMRSDDPKAVRVITGEMLATLGNQAGVPDGRRAGRKATPRAISEAEATNHFLDALQSEERTTRQFMEAKLLPDQMLRFYASVLDAVVTIRPYAAKHQAQALGDLDKLTRGLVTLLTTLQQPEGHFPFPDLRGKNIRFGDMIDQQIREGKAAVRDGWIVTPDPEGGTQFDTGLCGTTLLLAGKLHGNDAWKRAGLRAADWALGQPCCGNFNYNAFSVSLLVHAFQVTGESKYLESALKKFRVGIAPGQAPNGRWIDSHNARTVYHLILLRALGDLASALPAERTAVRAEVDAVTRPALQALLDEFDAMGITVEALPELLTLAELHPGDARLRGAVQIMAVSLLEKSTDGQRVRMGAQPHQLAAVARAAK